MRKLEHNKRSGDADEFFAERALIAMTGKNAASPKDTETLAAHMRAFHAWLTTEENKRDAAALREFRRIDDPHGALDFVVEKVGQALKLMASDNPDGPTIYISRELMTQALIRLGRQDLTT